jgi:zinc transporter
MAPGAVSQHDHCVDNNFDPTLRIRREDNSMTGSEATGAIHHFMRLDGAGGASPVEHATLVTTGHWVHLDAAHPDSRPWLQDHTDLIPTAIEALLAPETRPRLATRGANLLLTLRGVGLDHSHDLADMISLRIWCDGTRMISTRLRSLKSTQDVREALEEGKGPTSINGLLIFWVERMLKRMESPLQHLEESIMDMEDRALEAANQTSHADLSQLRRQILGLRRFLGPQREALLALADANVNWLDDLARAQLRESGERQSRHVDLLDHMYSRIAVAQEELRNTLSNQMNERMYVMSIAAALFLPLSFFTGLMGINVGGMPGIDDAYAFWIVVGLCGIAISGLLFLFRKQGWW